MTGAAADAYDHFSNRVSRQSLSTRPPVESFRDAEGYYATRTERRLSPLETGVNY